MKQPRKIKQLLLMFCIVICSIVICCSEEAMAIGSQVPILMYHNLTVNGEINSMVVTQERFQEDMEFLQQQGYTPLTSMDLVNIKSGAMAMPQRPVMITFDDGYESNYTLAYPILKETGMKATISLITSHIKPAPSIQSQFMTWAQAREMYQSGLVDIGCHTHALHNEWNAGMQTKKVNGIQRKRGEKWAAYQKRVGKDFDSAIACIKKYIPGIQVRYFSYPFGATDSWFGQQIKDHAIRVTTTTTKNIASISNGLYGLPRIRITMEESVSEIFSKCFLTKSENIHVLVDETVQYELTAYNIDGSYYLKLRDAAKLVQDTPTQFNVVWDGNRKQTEIITGQYYMPLGDELRQGIPNVNMWTKTQTRPFLVNGQCRMLASYFIAQCSYVKLRSLGEITGFATGWDPYSSTIIIQTH